jgi:1-acyl-sn-glycerol-3-phosphate acyltransferase
VARRPRRYPPLPEGLYKLLRVIIRFLARLLTRLHIEGVEHVPASGACILISNHLSYMDSPINFAATPRVIHVLAGEKYEHHLLFGPLLRVAGAVFIRRGEVDRKALRQALAILEDGHCLGMAIEGTRSRTGGLIQGKTGAAYLATRADVPLVPVAIWGTDKMGAALRRFRRADVYVRYGKPFRLPPGHARTAQLDQYTDEIMVTLASMLPEEYRGIYRDHPLLKQKLAQLRSSS